MLRTLSKTGTPTGPAGDAEYYELFIESKVVNGQGMFFVKEKHGWWDAARKLPIHSVTTLCPEEGLSSFDEAQSMYETHVLHRVSAGFTHSYTPDYYGSDPFGFVYQDLAKT